MANSIVTRVFALNSAIANLPTDIDNYAEVVAKLEAIKASIEKKSASKSTKPTANQLANEAIKQTILDTLATCDEPVTIADLKTLSDEIGKYETSKLSQLLRQLYKSELCGGEPKVVRSEVKGKAYFSLA